MYDMHFAAPMRGSVSHHDMQESLRRRAARAREVKPGKRGTHIPTFADRKLMDELTRLKRQIQAESPRRSG